MLLVAGDDDLARYGFGDAPSVRARSPRRRSMREFAQLRGLDSGASSIEETRAPLRVKQRRTARLPHPGVRRVSCSERSASGLRLPGRRAIRQPAAASSNPRAMSWAPRCSPVEAADQRAAARRRAFVPIAGLHHASRSGARSRLLRLQRLPASPSRLLRSPASACKPRRVCRHRCAPRRWRLSTLSRDDPDLIFADHPRGWSPPVSGHGHANMKPDCRCRPLGTKLNIPLPPGANDDALSRRQWPKRGSRLPASRFASGVHHVCSAARTVWVAIR